MTPAHHTPRPAFTRRELLARAGTGFGSLALAGLLAKDAAGAPVPESAGFAAGPRGLHHAPRAKAVIHLFHTGGLSHVDSFDPKPALAKYAGKPLPESLRTERPTGAAMGSPFKFEPRGESGLPISDLFPELAREADELCVIRSMHADVPNHEPSLMLMNTGDGRLSRPSVGSWLNYGLGTENENLPGFVVLCPDGYPTKGSDNWRSAFLPGVYQGTYVNPRHRDIERLIENVRPVRGAEVQARQLDLLRDLNARHLAERPGDAALEARIESFEIAYRMQTAAAEAFDLSGEPKHVHERYGVGGKQTDLHARMYLTARRLIERGVRFVQLFHGKGQPWDHHDNLEKGHRHLAGQCDRPTAALLGDLRERGLLDDTLVLGGGKFGRTPTVELPKPGTNSGSMSGRDHNHYGFSVWLAGGGVRGGFAHGATDEFGFAAVRDRVHVHDLHATILHLMGIDHERLTHRYAGRDFRLTDVHGRVVREVLA